MLFGLASVFIFTVVNRDESFVILLLLRPRKKWYI